MAVPSWKIIFNRCTQGHVIRPNSKNRYSPQEIILKRAADLAEALYSMPRNNQLGLGAPRSPPSSMPFNTYTGQLAVSVQDTAASQWTEGGFLYGFMTSLKTKAFLLNEGVNSA